MPTRKTAKEKENPNRHPVIIEPIKPELARSWLLLIWGRPDVARCLLKQEARRIDIYRNSGVGPRDRSRIATLIRLSKLDVADLEFKDRREFLRRYCSVTEFGPPPASVDENASCTPSEPIAPAIRLETKFSPTEHEVGSERVTNGDVLIEAFVSLPFGGGRSQLAEKLRELALFINNTQGDPIDSASVFILLRRPR